MSGQESQCDVFLVGDVVRDCSGRYKIPDVAGELAKLHDEDLAI